MWTGRRERAGGRGWGRHGPFQIPSSDRPPGVYPSTVSASTATPPGLSSHRSGDAPHYPPFVGTSQSTSVNSNPWNQRQLVYNGTESPLPTSNSSCSNPPISASVPALTKVPNPNIIQALPTHPGTRPKQLYTWLPLYPFPSLSAPALLIWALVCMHIFIYLFFYAHF